MKRLQVCARYDTGPIIVIATALVGEGFAIHRLVSAWPTLSGFELIAIAAMVLFVLPSLCCGFLFLWLRVALVGRCGYCHCWMRRSERPNARGEWIHNCCNCGRSQRTNVFTMRYGSASALGGALMNQRDEDKEQNRKT